MVSTISPQVEEKVLSILLDSLFAAITAEYINFQVGPNYKEDKELILYPNKGGKVSDILQEAAKVVEMAPDGSGT